MHDTVFDYGSHDKGRTKILFDLFILWLMIVASVVQSSWGLQKISLYFFHFWELTKMIACTQITPIAAFTKSSPPHLRTLTTWEDNHLK